MPMLYVQGHDQYSAGQVAEALVLTLEEIRAALTPIIGPQAVTALYRRSLLLCAANHPFFESVHEYEETVMNTSSLKALLAKQSHADARQSGDALISTFYTLLASLIGPSLTEQLVGDCTAGSMDRTNHQSSEK
ncbi:hypothetical protein [Pseudomonas nunensis]|uniref:Uncharacterized protein n=1 Tax=Pseudomonas nunensis TaxID=2961896 RepID=A0ABY5EPW4_9PSED|nr:hypothetical protein [Pseudomonas nunensis]MCL5225428.1 hypothetical protein [Pseudomonas nunensis]UTO16812.1 hypothetical protein NK667_10830 [Pseudomonas nunensis]